MVAHCYGIAWLKWCAYGERCIKLLWRGIEVKMSKRARRVEIERGRREEGGGMRERKIERELPLAGYGWKERGNKQIAAKRKMQIKAK